MLWEVEELIKISSINPEEVEEAMKYLWGEKPELYISVVINAYIDKKINLTKASELLGTTRRELEKELRQKGIPIRHLTQEDIIAEVEAIKEW